MLLDPKLTAAYVVVATALAIAPGPDFLFVVANGMRHKIQGAIAAAVGIGCGSLLQAVAAALGVSAVVAASPVVFEALKYAGAAYLFYLGIQAVRSCRNHTTAHLADAAPVEVSAWNVFRRGLITNLLNPKVVVFYLALLPQFVNIELGHVGLQIFLLGCIHNVLGVTYLVVVGLAAGRASKWLAQSGFGRWIDGLAGVFFIGLAIRLVLTGKPEH